MTTNGDVLIRVENLQKAFGDFHALNGITEEIHKGEVVVIIGPSGSGKSTFLRSLNLLEVPTGGHIYFEGVDITDAKVDIDKHRQKMGMVFQHFNLFPHKTILENITLAPIFIFVFKMGIAGAAHATNIAFFVGSIWVVLHFFDKKTNIRFHRKNLKLDRQIVKSILNIGMSPFSMQIAASVTVVIINRALIRYGGDLAVGALGIQNAIATLVVMFIIGLNQGAQPILGFNYGARKFDRMFMALKKTAVAATLVSTAGFILGTFFPHALASLFTRDEELKELAARALRISVTVFPLIGSQIVITNFFQSIGKAKISMTLSLTRQVLFLIPCLIFLPPIFGLDGVWSSMPVADSLSVIVTTSTLVFFIRKFKKRQNSAFI